MSDALLALVKQAETNFFPWVVDELIIQTDDQLKNANDMLGIGKKLEKVIEAQRVTDKAPVLAEAKRIDDEYKPVINRVHLGVSRLDAAVLAYHKKKKAEADALLLMQMQEEAKKIEESKHTGEVYEAPAAIVKPVSQTVRGNMSTTSVIQSFLYEIVEPDLVPRELCSPDLAKIKAKHKYDKLPVPGVLITPTERTSTRLG
jgi:hypothetical protein